MELDYEEIKPMEEYGFKVTGPNQKLFIKDLEESHGIKVSLSGVTCGYDLQQNLENTNFENQFKDNITTMVAFEKLPNEESDSLYVIIPVNRILTDTQKFEILSEAFPSIPSSEIGWFKAYDYEDEYHERRDDQD